MAHRDAKNELLVVSRNRQSDEIGSGATICLLVIRARDNVGPL